MLEESIFLSSVMIGFVVPSVLIVIGLCKGKRDSPPLDENVEIHLDESILSGNGSSSSDDQKESASESDKSEKVSSESEKSRQEETANSLERLRRNCDNLLGIFPLEDSDRAGMGSLVNDIISSPRFIEKIESKDKNASDIASIMIEAASSVFSKEEQDYIRRKMDCLTTLVKTKEGTLPKEDMASFEKNPEMLLATINSLSNKKTQ